MLWWGWPCCGGVGRAVEGLVDAPMALAMLLRACCWQGALKGD
ncbi:hypothetical protein [Magnetococcus sp. PR-3]